jgi:hypothetical protein
VMIAYVERHPELFFAGKVKTIDLERKVTI